MTLSEELAWRGFVNQTTYKDVKTLDGDPITFYWGVDPSADSMTVGNFAMAMMVRHFIDHGHKAILLVGGATGMIGDPDGKKQERDLKSLEEIQHNKDSIAAQYRQIFAGKDFEIVDNYDWFQGMGYLNFLRDVGKHVPMRQMLGREFIQSRLSDEGDGISYAEFSYALIQGYDFLHLYREKGATLQVSGADQWGNSIAGVELIRRIAGGEAHVWTGPIVVNKSTGVKFGKSEAGAIWLDPAKTTPTQFYQFWINCDDAGVEDYLKIYTLLSKPEIEAVMTAHNADPGARIAQTHLAVEVTKLVHGSDAMQAAEVVTSVLTGKRPIGEADSVLEELRREIPAVSANADGSILEALVGSGLASSNSEARRLVKGNAISVNGQKIARESFEASDFQNGRLLLRRGKAFKDSALVELQ
ncbi:tyrosine--tRNA ligase [Candidatus Saccharibacteria bacterium]|nr:MAG: tyrosine--tRNA ligase [Candidatus Saccharibacteria bacterium]